MPFFVIPLPTADQVKKGAAKAKNVSVAGYNSAKGRYQSSSFGNGASNSPSSNSAPPPPPPRGATNASLYGPPPTRTASSSSAVDTQGSHSPAPPPAAPPRPPLPQRNQSKSSLGSPAGSPVPPHRPPLPARSSSKSGSPVSPPARPPLPQRSTSTASSQSSAPSPAPRPTPSPRPSAPPPPIARHSRPAPAAASPPAPPPPPAPAPTHIAHHDRAPWQSTQRQEIVEIDAIAIDWVNLTYEDKNVFFSWLDEFFARYMDATSSDSGGAGAVSGVSKTAPKPGFRAHAAAPPPAPRVHAPPPSASPARGPPRINLGTKPTSVSPALVEDDLEMSYPPPTEHGCTALDIAYYFHPSTHWTEAWYSKPKGLPTPLQNEGRVRWRANTSWVGTTQTLYAGFLFADLSICWFSVTYDKVTPADPNDAAAVQRHAEYLPRPAPMDGAALRAAHDTYGEIVAAFAESFAGTGRFCARGECWDLANEALAHAARLLPAAPPVGSIARTHGHLIFKGTPRAGRWYGGDDRVRRGDVVEWRLARLDLPRGAYASFGNPDHTAVITADAVPTRTPVHGGALHPSELVQLEVVEQGVDSPPVKKTYPLAGFKDGEVWIYRPVGMQAYVGAELAPTPPAGVRTLTL